MLETNTSALKSFSRKHQLASSMTVNLVHSPLKRSVAVSFPYSLVLLLSSPPPVDTKASVLDVAGAAILPSDVASRKATECDNPTCQECSFVQRTEDFLVIHASVTSILPGTAKIPYISRAA